MENIRTQELSAENVTMPVPPVEEENVQPSIPPAGDKMVPLAALHQERDKVKALRQDKEAGDEIIKKLMERTGCSSPRELEAKMDEEDFEEVLKNAGSDKKVADILMRQQERMREMEKESRLKDAAIEVERLRHNPLYPDIDKLGGRVLSYADEKGLTVKEAYNALFAEARAEKIRAITREEALREYLLKQDKKIPALSEAGNTGTKSAETGLTPEEASWARTAGISLEDYAKYKSKN